MMKDYLTLSLSKGFALIYILISLAIAAVVVFGAFIIQKNAKVTPVINSFEECLQAGYPALESYPRQCKTLDGKSFTEKVTEFPTLQLTGSGIKGQITIGPTCPAVGPGMEKECADKPYQGTIIVKSADGKKEVTRFTSENDGNFQINLAPGKYVLEAEPGKSQLPFLKPETVTVEANKYTEVAISFDSGIR